MSSIILQIILLLLGFTLLSLSMSRHFSQVTNKRQRLAKSTVWLFRMLGYGLIIVSVLVAINAWGVVLGLVYCFGTAMLVTLLLSLILAYRPRWLSVIPKMMKLM
ncbi:MAG: DUF3325 domain-containing protein [Colwellia sp.]